MTRTLVALLFAPALALAFADGGIYGRVLDPTGAVVGRGEVTVQGNSVRKRVAGREGLYRVDGLASGAYTVTAEAAGFASVSREVVVADGQLANVDLRLESVEARHETIVIRGAAVEPDIDMRDDEVYNRTLLSRDDQLFKTLAAGIDAGQHEGGGKSVEIRRFGFNLDHGGVNGGLKVLVDDVEQNQGTQGHGQGYLGSLKALSPELIQEVEVVNGPFSAEYGDFSGLGVVHIRQRESLGDRYTLRLQGGNFGARRGFFAWSPDVDRTDAYAAYEGSYTDGPFENPGRYRRDNVNANYTRTLDERTKLGFRALFGRNNFYSSGQLPLDQVESGALDRFGYIDPSDGGRVKLGVLSTYVSRTYADGGVLKADGFVSRSLFDLFSNFTFFLNDPVNGDAFQQHDSRLQEGVNAQYTRPNKLGPFQAALVAGGNFHDNQINVGLYPRIGRDPIGVSTRAQARVTNQAGYAQENVSMLGGRLLLGAGLRYDSFRYGVEDRVSPELGGVRWAGAWQGKAHAAFTPSRRVPLTFHLNYGRGINSVDARGAVQHPDQPRLATTDFSQAGVSSHAGRVDFTGSVFLIDHSHEQVYVPDDGSFEFKGPSRAYGVQSKLSIAITRKLSLNGGVTKVANAFYRGGDHRVYVDSAPRFVADAGLTLAGWRGWSGSLRMRAINHYRLDGEDPSIVAAGHTVFDLAVARPIRRGIELNFGIDNALSRSYWETQNYFESRVAPGAPVVVRVHATPAYPLTATAGVTLRFGGK